MTAARETRLDAVAARRLLTHLRQLEREVAEARQFRRIDALDAVREAVRRIGEIGSPEGVLERAPEEIGTSSAFRRVLIGHVRDGVLTPHAIWAQDGATAVAPEGIEPIALRYPLVEHEIAQHQGAAIVDAEAVGSRSPRALTAALGWRSYVVAAITLRGATVGMLHADRPGDERPVDALDLEVATIFAAGLAGAFERAALRRKLQRHREELDVAVRWIGSRLEHPAADLDSGPPEDADGDDDPGALDALTRREREVLQLMARGRTNRAIAEALMISEGTAKYHVKNVLRKLQATSRADAVARHLRATRGGRA